MRAHVLVPVRASARPCVPPGHIPTGHRRTLSHAFMKHIYTPTRLRCWPQAPHSRYFKVVFFITCAPPFSSPFPTVPLTFTLTPCAFQGLRTSLGGVSQCRGCNQPVLGARRAIFIGAFARARRRTTTKTTVLAVTDGHYTVTQENFLFFFFFCVSGLLRPAHLSLPSAEVDDAMCGCR